MPNKRHEIQIIPDTTLKNEELGLEAYLIFHPMKGWGAVLKDTDVNEIVGVNYCGLDREIAEEEIKRFIA